MKQLTDQERKQLGEHWGEVLHLDYVGNLWLLGDESLTDLDLYYRISSLVYNRYKTVRSN